MSQTQLGADEASVGDRPRGPRVLIVGAGFGGIAAAIELRRHGFEQLTILDSAPGIGGTWLHNSYPGAACDVPSHLYSYSYEQRRNWTRLCSPQPEILSYVREVAHDYGLDSLVKTSCRVTECRLDEPRGVWCAESECGEHFEADALVVATGQLNRPCIPSLPGLHRFAGHSFHSARWDHDYELTGKRVAVVGTGASAVQFIPRIAPAVAALAVYQRTGNWMLPRCNRVYPRWLRRVIHRVPAVQRLRRRWMFSYCESLTVAIRHPRTLGRLLGLRSSIFMRGQLHDPELRAKVWPNYTFGCKRVLFSSQYLPMLGRENVELITDPIGEVTETGLRTVEGDSRDFDCIIWSTGFRASEFMSPMKVRGAGGRELHKVWERGAHAHLGLTVPGFASMFLMYGPNTNTSGGSIIFYLEAQASYIRRALEYVRGHGYAKLDVRPEVEAASDYETQAKFQGTAWTACDSWYRDGQGRIVANWPGYMGDYLKRTRTFQPAEFVFS